MSNPTRSPNRRFSLPPEAWQAIANAFGLARREAEVLECVVGDQHENDIALALGLSRHTIRTYLKRLRAKVGASSRVEMVKRVLGEHSTWVGESNPP